VGKKKSDEGIGGLYQVCIPKKPLPKIHFEKKNPLKSFWDKTKTGLSQPYLKSYLNPASLIASPRPTN
jgi:hypothetical protein